MQVQFIAFRARHICCHRVLDAKILLVVFISTCLYGTQFKFWLSASSSALEPNLGQPCRIETDAYVSNGALSFHSPFMSLRRACLKQSFIIYRFISVAFEPERGCSVYARSQGKYFYTFFCDGPQRECKLLLDPRKILASICFARNVPTLYQNLVISC